MPGSNLWVEGGKTITAENTASETRPMNTDGIWTARGLRAEAQALGTGVCRPGRSDLRGLKAPQQVGRAWQSESLRPRTRALRRRLASLPPSCSEGNSRSHC